MTLRRLPAVVGLAVAQLRHDRTRTILAVLGVTLAVLSTTLLAGTGIGVVQTGQEQFDNAGRDLWITGGPVQFAPTQVGGIQNSVYDAHETTAELQQREGVATVGPLLFQTVYVSRTGDDFQRLAAMGLPSSNGVAVSEGRGFANDSHYADGTYEGPMTHEILVDPRTAELLDVEVGDTIYVGGTLATARANEFEIVGVSSTGSQFLGAPTVTLPLSELQEITGKTATDPATIIAITTTDGTSPAQLESRLEEAYPGLDVRTNREQLQATLERQAVVLAGGVSLIVLAVLAGLALTLNILFSMVYQQRSEYAALKALGSSTMTIAGTVFTQALIVGLLGTGIGLAATIPLADALNAVAATVTGFDDVVRLQPRVYALGFGVAVVMSLVSGVLASWRMAHVRPLQALRN
jgi:putative ABC transport system permease protein